MGNEGILPDHVIPALWYGNPARLGRILDWSDGRLLMGTDNYSTPRSRSASAFPADYRRVLEESNLPIEVATAIADRLDGPSVPSATDATAKDATRYRWLTEKADRIDDFNWRLWVCYGPGETFNDAIDAAMAAIDRTA